MEEERGVFYAMVVGNPEFEEFLDNKGYGYHTDEYGEFTLEPVPDAPGPSGPTKGYKLILAEPDESPMNEEELEDFYFHIADLVEGDFKENGGSIHDQDFLFC